MTRYYCPREDVDDLEHGRYSRFEAQIVANEAISCENCAKLFPEAPIQNEGTKPANMK